MTVFSPVRLSVLVTFVLCLLAPPCLADAETSKAELENCLWQKIPAERAEASPSVDDVIAACQVEYDTFVADLTPNTRDATTHAVRDIIHKKLTQ